MKKSFLVAVLANILICSGAVAQCFEMQEFSGPGDYQFVVPSDQAMYEIEIEVRGGDGGDFIWTPNPQSDGGAGATMTAVFEIAAGTVLDVFVGGSGSDGPGSPGGGGGGGGSAVIVQNDQVLIAAAGGGGGGQGVTGIGQGGQANTNSAAQGGAAPGASGGGGYNEAGADGAAGSGGGAGTLTSSGVGGMGGVTAGDGGPGFGGGGGGSGTGGGGGGGYQGGDGSQSGALAGLGGDSYLTSDYSSVLVLADAGIDGGGLNVNGHVMIRCQGADDLDITVVSSENPNCNQDFGGEIIIEGVGGTLPYSYSINQGTPNSSGVFSLLAAGSFILTVFDGNGDEATTMVTLVDPEVLTLEVVSVVDNICFGALDGSLTVAAGGGTSTTGEYSFSINGSPLQSSPTFDGLASGFVVISVFDDNDCESQITSMISSPPGIGLFVSAQSDVTCNGASDGTATIFASGGVGDLTFELDGVDVGTDNMYDDLAAGAHAVVVTDQNGCTESISFALEEPEELVINLLVDSTACEGAMDGSIGIDIEGGTPDYVIAVNGTTIDTNVIENLGAGSYDIIVTDANGCIIEALTSIPDPIPVDLAVVSTTEASCAGLGSVQLGTMHGSGPPVYIIDTIVSPDGFFELPAGTYEASILIGGCTATTIVTIAQASDLTASITDVIDPSCPGDNDGAFTVGITGGTAPFSYTLNDGEAQDSAIYTNLPTGFYTVVVEDSLSCTTMISLMIDDPAPIDLSLFVGDVPCYGEMTGVIGVDPSNGTGPYTISIDSMNLVTEGELVSQDTLAPGTYMISVVDADGCSVDTTATIAESDSLELSIDSLGGVVCNLGTQGYASFSAEGGMGSYQYALNSGQLGDGQFEDLLPGVYQAMVFDSLGCAEELEFEITTVGSLVINDALVTDVSCNGDQDGIVDIVVNSAIGHLSAEIDSVTYTGTSVGGLGAGSYDAVLTDEAGCIGEIDFVVNGPEVLVISIDDFENGGGSDGFVAVSANGGTAPYQYGLDDIAILQDEARFEELSYGSFVIYVVDSNGCVDSVSQLLTTTSDFAETFGLEVNPNPAQDVIFANVRSVTAGMTVTVTDITGRTVIPYKAIHDRSTRIDIRSLEAGTYIMLLSTDQGFVGQRFIKQ